MANIPDEIEIKGRKTIRNTMLVLGGLSGLLAYGFVQNGNAKGVLICGALAAALIFGATKVKTHRKLVTKGGVYK